MREKRVILSAGGTGGHLFPAQAVADNLVEQCEILFVGGGLSSNRYFDQKKYPFCQIDSATLTFRSPLKALSQTFRILKGLIQSLKILKSYKPDLVVGFGSFFTFPLLLAAKLKRIPIILHEQNTLPGKVNRLFARGALITAITFPETAKFLSGKTQRVAFPLRFRVNRVERKIACDYFSLDPNKKTILVFGGSQGGLGLNRLFLESAPSLPKDVQILHFTGNREMESQATRLYRGLSFSFCVKEFETRMDLAWSLADLAFTRSGAATIAELIAWEVPAILIPFPHATDGHQEKNGKHFTEVVQGGAMYLEGTVTSGELRKTIKAFLRSTTEKKKEIERYKKANVCEELHELILRDKNG